MTSSDLLDFAETSHQVQAGPYSLHYHESGTGDAFVLLHGSGPGVSGWSNFRGNFPVFAKRFRTIILDMPGFGLSEGPPLDRAYPKVAADALLLLLDELGIEKTHLLGNSMGGYVAAEFALDNPTRVDRLVMMGPGGLAINTFSPPQSEGAKRLFEFLDDPTRERMVAWVECMVSNMSVVSDELIDERTANANKPGQIERTRDIFASLGRFPNPTPPWTRAHQITQRTLITWGRDDRMLPVDGAFTAWRMMPNADLMLLSNCGHWAQVERKSDFESLVVDFLTRP
jgi:4,5:9,10-diseco-3-hydroxy-5,9,17-trioxoandrosta-1(10),2-diene-4-oate hydrolase